MDKEMEPTYAQALDLLARIVFLKVKGGDLSWVNPAKITQLITEAEQDRRKLKLIAGGLTTKDTQQ